MSAPVRQRGFLLTLAAEGIAPLMRGCAHALREERAINRFGLPIVERWRDWLHGQSSSLCASSISELAELPAANARAEAVAAIDQLAPSASLEDRTLAVDYLAAIPRSAQRYLVLDHQTGGFTFPREASPEQGSSLLALLPLDAPLNVAESTQGTDLAMLLANLKHQTGHGFSPEDVLKLIREIIQQLASIHPQGKVHGDLKPASVLVSGDTIKLAEPSSERARDALTLSRIGTLPIEQLSPADQVSLLRGAGTLLYLSPEQRRGDPPDPRHDLYSLGVLWYQLLMGDVTRPLHVGWKAEVKAPANQLALIERCVGPMESRPRDASGLLPLLHPARAGLEQHRTAFREVSPEEIRRERQRKRDLLQGLRLIRTALRQWQSEDLRTRRASWVGFLYLPVALAIGLTIFLWLRNAILAVLAAMTAGLEVHAQVVHFRRRRTWALRDGLMRQLDQLAKQYTEEILAWGGKQALLNDDLLDEIIAAFEEDMRTLAIDDTSEPSL
jgi:hypothetical protein